MRPKWQEDSSCVFAYYFVAALAIAAIPQEKKTRRSRFSTGSATAPSEQGIFAPCGSVLTWHK